MACTFVTEGPNFYLHEKDRTNFRTFFSRFSLPPLRAEIARGSEAPRKKQVLSEPVRNINNGNNVNNIEKG